MYLLGFTENKPSTNIDNQMEYFYPTSKIRFMSTKLPELSIHEIALERETVTKLLGVYLLMKMSNGKLILIQFIEQGE